MKTDKLNLRSREVSYLLDISPDEVIQLARRKELKAKKEGKLWKYRLEDVLAYKKRTEKDE